jgi:hypothetical protein
MTSTRPITIELKTLDQGDSDTSPLRRWMTPIGDLLAITGGADDVCPALARSLHRAHVMVLDGPSPVFACPAGMLLKLGRLTGIAQPTEEGRGLKVTFPGPWLRPDPMPWPVGHEQVIDLRALGANRAAFVHQSFSCGIAHVTEGPTVARDPISARFASNKLAARDGAILSLLGGSYSSTADWVEQWIRAQGWTFTDAVAASPFVIHHRIESHDVPGRELSLMLAAIAQRTGAIGIIAESVAISDPDERTQG